MVIFWNYKQSQFPVAKTKPLNFNLKKPRLDFRHSLTFGLCSSLRRNLSLALSSFQGWSTVSFSRFQYHHSLIFFLNTSFSPLVAFDSRKPLKIRLRETNLEFVVMPLPTVSLCCCCWLIDSLCDRFGINSKRNYYEKLFIYLFSVKSI